MLSQWPRRIAAGARRRVREVSEGAVPNLRSPRSQPCTRAQFDELAGDQFYSAFSYEEIGRLDRDLLMWVAGDAETMARIESNPLRAQLTAATEGREIFLRPIEAGAFSFSSPLSLPYLLDVLVPQIEAALDGDPATAVPPGE